MGVDFNYRDIIWRKLYEVLVNLTPGVKWNMEHCWQAVGEIYIPALNDYGKRYGRVKLNVAALSKEMYFRNKWFLKASDGVFSRNRYGLDLKGMYVVKDCLAFEAQLGITKNQLRQCRSRKSHFSSRDIIVADLNKTLYCQKRNTSYQQ